MNISTLTHIPRQPLITKASQIHAGTDRRQNTKEVKNNNSDLSKTDNQMTFNDFLSAALNRRKRT
ncbi:hypothetical protein AWH56_010095 [Anaerobacillus isosaccharinicus]|uniref:Uncharacterized protein n=1 Tax=Anaerobacillus isosaccharinicus TaxID=1532552 RepID=A0A1S2L5H0_9BACI|nr:hypothetical protein [Anaerobacillus isosaccharinicus]MBA5588720.1 hypothetical protein [Anaerobacillus isosaccharinicus]QOY37879.1 hypothetical protein AWH56_010095 [Anaerobacillus isosaccharinicus]